MTGKDGYWFLTTWVASVTISSAVVIKLSLTSSISSSRSLTKIVGSELLVTEDFCKKQNINN